MLSLLKCNLHNAVSLHTMYRHDAASNCQNSSLQVGCWRKQEAKNLAASGAGIVQVLRSCQLQLSASKLCNSGKPALCCKAKQTRCLIPTHISMAPSPKEFNTRWRLDDPRCGQASNRAGIKCMVCSAVTAKSSSCQSPNFARNCHKLPYEIIQDIAMFI